MKHKTILIIFICTGLMLISISCRMAKSNAVKSNEIAEVHTVETNNDEPYAELVEALKNLPVDGPSFGGPYVGLSTNAATEAVVQKGALIVPTLVSALDHSSWTQSVWIVFCINHLHATTAKERILKLQQEIDNGRFTNEPHDLTLDAEIQAYLAVIGNRQQ